MKQIATSILLSALLLVSIGSSSGTSGNQQTQLPDSLKENLRFFSGVVEEHKEDLPEMLKAGRIRVLTTLTFGNYFIFKGQAYGYEYSQMEEFKQFLNKGKPKGKQLEFYYIPVPYDLLVPALNRGFGDIVAANLTILPERLKDADFTAPYLWGLQEVLVTGRAVKGITKIEDLSGRKVHVRDGSSYEFSLEKLNEQLRQKKLAPVKIERLPGLVNTGEIIEMINAGTLEMTIADSHIASIAGELLPGVRVRDDIVLNDDVRFGWMVRKDNPQLKASLNAFIKTIKKGTLKGNMYFKRYFKENPWVRDALKRNDVRTFYLYAPLFKKYGEQFGIDPYLIAAQSFQESRFDPKAKSPFGAVGLMQVLPSTAKEVGVADISTPEKNVLAGVKYLRQIMDRYFPEDEFTGEERVRFALAAYNAGAGNISLSRRTAKGLGYDDKIWFGQTEFGAMRKVGLEPVHYVRNINRYYLAFLVSGAILEMKDETLPRIKK
jgi:membrane-bound lytic murein transglycosylase MltF